MRKLDFPLAPVLLGLVPGYLTEINLRRAMTISDGDVTYLFSSPIAIVLWVLAAVSLLFPVLIERFRKRGMGSGEEV